MFRKVAKPEQPAGRRLQRRDARATEKRECAVCRLVLASNILCLMLAQSRLE